MQTIFTNNLVKSYGNKTVLSGINLDISSGSVVGLLGKNGAGKTTLNRILTGLSFPSSGEVLILGNKPACGSNKISFLSENIAIYPSLTAYENISQIFLLNNIRPDKKRIEEILDSVSIENSKKKAGRFSLGMKRRLQIAMSILVVDRDIIILDEPTNGLDINGVLWLKKLLISLRKSGRTLIITSHAIRELEDVLTHYSIIANGKIALNGNIDDIDSFDITIVLNRQEIDRGVQLLRENDVRYKASDHNSIVIPDADHELSQECLNLLIANHIVPLRFSSEKRSLVDIFMSITDSGE